MAIVPRASCGNCRFMRGSYTQPSPQVGGEEIRAGWCHKTVPTMAPDLQASSHRPVRLDGWCGEHERLWPLWVRVLMGAFWVAAGVAVGRLVLRFLINMG